MEQEVPRDQGAAFVQVWAARVSLCCRLGLCCCAQAEVLGVHWHAAPGVVEEGQRSCASCLYCWWY